jgi:hypothetical protein
VKGIQGIFDKINERKKIRCNLEEFVGKNRKNWGYFYKLLIEIVFIYGDDYKIWYIYDFFERGYLIITLIIKIKKLGRLFERMSKITKINSFRQDKRYRN